ncbi:MAG: hypothetical protein ACJ8GO_10995 [Ramlibacter sp.]
MATTRKPAVRSAAAPVKPVVAVKPSAKLAATPAGQSAAAGAAKAKTRPKTKAKADKPAKAANGAKAPKADKPKKPKLVRDSFTMPKAEYAVLEVLKARAVKAGKPAKKSELLRAGIKALVNLPDLAFVSALDAVTSLKTARRVKA